MSGIVGGLVTFAVAVLVVLTLLSSIKIVNTGYVYIVERLGVYNRTLQPGWHFIIPFVDCVRGKVSLKQQVLDVDPQSIITKDNVNVKVDTVVFYQVLDAKLSIYNIENYVEGIVYSTITSMRAVCGNLTLDDMLSGREKINSQLLTIVDKITDAYGIKILSCEIKNIEPPSSILKAMESQMKAEREKRAKILEAEGNKQSEIARAEAEKQSKILRAEAEKEANIKRAEGLKESQLLEAEGKAKAIQAVSIAEADAIKKINSAIINSGTDERVIAVKQIEALKEMAKNPANKLIIPQESISTLGNISAIAETLRMTKENETKVIFEDKSAK